MPLYRIMVDITTESELSPAARGQLAESVREFAHGVLPGTQLALENSESPRAHAHTHSSSSDLACRNCVKAAKDGLS